MITYNDEPNFSIVVPGVCNANCNFCFGDSAKIKPVSVREYVPKLCKALSSMPNQFHQISITGGEPLVSSYIASVLTSVLTVKDKYTNIVLSTNGTNLVELNDIVSMAVDHINISRHHWDEPKNKKVFGGTYNVKDADIINAIAIYSKHGIDLTANCVINDNTTKEFIGAYIGWARNIGFGAVRFRKENGTLKKTPAELSYKDHAIVWRGGCPACETELQIIGGFRVFWKRSILDPGKVDDKVFEVIFAPDGKLYTDWKCTNLVGSHTGSRKTSSEKPNGVNRRSRGGGGGGHHSCGKSRC